jgi:hypothetical protein
LGLLGEAGEEGAGGGREAFGRSLGRRALGRSDACLPPFFAEGAGGFFAAPARFSLPVARLGGTALD